MGKIHSLKKSVEFQRVYRRRRSFGNKYLVMYLAENNSEDLRLGISVSKKVGNSVVRHRLARLIRESFRLNMDTFRTGYDIIFVARPSAKGKGYTEIESAMLNLCKLHGILSLEESK